jgi:16S rRNA (cytosine1402-N4)-methyltransferase
MRSHDMRAYLSSTQFEGRGIDRKRTHRTSPSVSVMQRSFIRRYPRHGSSSTAPRCPMSDQPVFSHVPVMLAEVLQWINETPSIALSLDGSNGTSTMVDATLGGAGHTMAALRAESSLRVLGLDRDPLAVRVATERLSSFGERARVRHCRYDSLLRVVREENDFLSGTIDPSSTPPTSMQQGVAPSPSVVLSSFAPTDDDNTTEPTSDIAASKPVDVVLFDLGVSSAQLDLADRGFSYRQDADLDMRMDTTTGVTAADVCNTYGERELANVLRIYGDEKFAGRVARSIIAHRPITRTVQLAEIVVTAIPAATRRTGGHPAKRTFQALRIEVNDELRVLTSAIDQALDVLRPGGRCIVLSYHSGEDRIVKDRFRLAETGGCSCPSGLPCVCGALPRGRMIRRGVTRPTAAEEAANPRAASAVARVFEMALPAADDTAGGSVAMTHRKRGGSDPNRTNANK